MGVTCPASSITTGHPATGYPRGMPDFPEQHRAGRSPQFDDELLGLDPDDPEAQAFAAHLDRMRHERPAFTVEGYLDGVREFADSANYSCRACGAELFRSDTKFESHCGWPSFFTPLAGDAVIERVDNSMGMRRVEVICANCHSHLGHVFSGEGYDTPTDLRYCINSVSLRLEPDTATT